MKKVLLHSCCAPCSAAILEHLVKNDYDVTIFFYNPNIYPYQEYEKRKQEIVRYAHEIGISIVDLDVYSDTSWNDSYSNWKKQVEHLAQEPERGERCLECFKYRLAGTARYAAENKFDCFTTTLASSRWKDLDQINQAGNYAASLYPQTKFWEKNWRKGGLYERRNELAKQFYNQQYCGCEFSVGQLK